MLEIKSIVTKKYRDQIDNKLLKYEDWINIKYRDQFKILISQRSFVIFKANDLSKSTLQSRLLFF